MWYRKTEKYIVMKNTNTKVEILNASYNGLKMYYYNK